MKKCFFSYTPFFIFYRQLNRKQRIITCWQATFLAATIALPTVSLAQVSRPETDVQALVKLGPRVAGTPVMEKARSYLIQQFRQAGYNTEVQTFTYPKFEDLGSNLIVNGQTIKGLALNGSVAGKMTAPLVVVPNVGRSADFAKVDVKGAIAIVRRGEIRFSEKAQNATAAGAVGLAIVNNKPDSLFGASGDGQVKIPVLTLAGEPGNALINRIRNQKLQASLNVNTRERVVTGRNVIAHLKGVTQPKVLLGAHYDSVSGAPGANDNASGTAVILEIARRLSRTPLAQQTWFVAFDGEEDGLYGSKAFVNTAQPQFLSNLEAMLNFDMVGINNDLHINGTYALKGLTQGNRFISNGKAVGGSDHIAFAAADVPVLFFHRGLEPNYHTPNDKQVNPKLLDETVSAGLDVVKQILSAKVSEVNI